MLPRKTIIYRRLIFYIPLVLVGFTVDFVVFLLLINWGFQIFLANSIAFLFGASTNICLVRFFVFSNTSLSKRADFSLTLVINTLVMFLGSYLIYFFNSRFGLSLTISKLAVNFFTLTLNFTLRGWLDRYGGCFQNFQKKR